jgi:hypothetical protein
MKNEGLRLVIMGLAVVLLSIFMWGMFILALKVWILK